MCKNLTNHSSLTTNHYRTIVSVTPFAQQIEHSQWLVFIGSCFAENIGARFRQARFRTDVNPFGVLYNPLSIASALRRLISAKPYGENDLFFDSGQWHSADHHSSFSDKDKSACLQKINSRLAEASENLRNARHLFITFGTAWIYEWAENGKIVGNCHKILAKKFKRRRLSVDEIVVEYDGLMCELRNFNPDINIVFTVSPIRHWKDGARENNLSKSTLLLAIDNLASPQPPPKEGEQAGASSFPPLGELEGAVGSGVVVYFPAYEIVMDDLRDYRFYALDMIHLSDVAIDYIWERVGEAFFSKKTRKIVDEAMQINKAREHRPFNPESEEYWNFIKAIDKKENELIKKI